MSMPEPMNELQEVEPRLGIKSSLPNAKSTVALAVLLWESGDTPAEAAYSKPGENNNIVIADDAAASLVQKLEPICSSNNISDVQLISKVNENQLFKSQLEALQVAFELVWKLAKIEFDQPGRSYAAERQGGLRYTKRLIYTTNMDIIHGLFASNFIEYASLMLKWLGFNIDVPQQFENSFTAVLNTFVEHCLFKAVYAGQDLVFIQNGVYAALLSTPGEPVNVSGSGETKGTLRVLKSLLADGMNPYLRYSNGNVTSGTEQEALLRYHKRVDTMLKLNGPRVIYRDRKINEETESENQDERSAVQTLENERQAGGINVLLYGVPGSGKSWVIEHEYCSPEDAVERIVFHPDYTNSDFVGQILPDINEDGAVVYRFKPGPFTTALVSAFWHPAQKHVLVIEELNRGNAAAIFGEVFQLLDRSKTVLVDHGITMPPGTSEYGITNRLMAACIYGDPERKVRIPSNLSIISTMNTSDQNVFALDTAFQRRWIMRLIENTFDSVRESLAEAEILDTGVTWKSFCTAVNQVIIASSLRTAVAEDKQLGVYFIQEEDIRNIEITPTEGVSLEAECRSLRSRENNRNITPDEKLRLKEIEKYLNQVRRFPEKVIKYLWDDAVRFDRQSLFDVSQFDSLEDVIHKFIYAEGRERLTVFNQNVVAVLCPEQ